MKRELLKFSLGLLFAGVLSTLAVAQAPTNNPYLARYPKAGLGHWTDSLKWANITDITTASGVVNNGVVDLAAFNALTESISNAGGGVVFFPAGEYFFGDDVKLPSGVILRGEEVDGNATEATFRPASKLRFPQYIFDPTLNGGAGMNNNEAFKGIEGKPGAHDIALVNLDINRARIEFQPTEYVTSPVANTQWPVDPNHNILVMGIRSNNVAWPDPNVPNASQQPWQRYGWRFSANIEVLASRNGIVVNNRINDEVTDTYLQPDYVGACATGPTDGSQAPFSYTEHYGISLNRGKIHRYGPGRPTSAGTGPNNPLGIFGWVTYASPTTEPLLFAPGNEVMDNWVYHTSRIGITAAGNGLKMIGNVIRDLEGKVVYLTPNGTGCQNNNSATYENRGLDFSGWNVVCERNDIEVYTALIRGGYPTVDGESILVQECCGGTVVKDYTVKHNVLSRSGSGYIGIYKMRNLFNVKIDSNDLGCKPIWVFADINNGPYMAFNTSIQNNTNVRSINVQAASGGSNMIIRGNSAGSCTSTGITAPGFADVGDNPGLGGGNTGPGSQVTPPVVDIVTPATDTTIFIDSSNPAPEMAFAYSFNDPETAEVALYAGTRMVVPFEAPTGTISWQLPTSVTTHEVSVLARSNDTNIPETWSRNTIRVNVFISTGLATRLPESAFKLYPVPARERLNIRVNETLNAKGAMQITDMAGRTVADFTLNEGQTDYQLPISNLAKGIYITRIQTNKGWWVSRLVVE